MKHIRHSTRTTLVTAAWVGLAAACGTASDRPTAASNLTIDGGSGGGGAALEFAGGDGGAGNISTVCSPSESNYEIPNNGCDDDGDGTVDEAVPCDGALPVAGDAAAFVKALGICQIATANAWGLVSAKFTRGWNQGAAPAEGQHGILGKFGPNVKPREGVSLGVLSTGYAREFNTANGKQGFGLGGTFKGGQTMTEEGGVPPGYPKPAAGCEIDTNVYDVISLELEIKAPNNARGLSFDLNFYSGEWPEFVCTSYNDGFAAFLRSSGFNGGSLDNISFDANKNPVSVNNGFFDRCTPNTETGCAGGAAKVAACPGGETEIQGTGFGVRSSFCGSKDSTAGGATGWLTSQAPITPGETFKLDLMIWDTGDPNYDSSVLVDNFTWQAGPTETKTERPK